MGDHPGIEVAAGAVRSYIDAFRLVRHVPHQILVKNGIGTIAENGEYTYDAKGAYPMDDLLAALRELEGIVGAKKMFEVGLLVPKNVQLPPGATDVRSAMQVLDSGYYLNHRKNGRPMFDPNTRSLLEGIGHYRCTSIDGREIAMEVDVPYPCEMDRGIMQAWARRYEPGALCKHVDPAVCRTAGAPSCRYVITYR